MAGGVNFANKRKPTTQTAPGKGDSQAPRPFSNSVNKSNFAGKQPTSAPGKDNRSMTVGAKSDKPSSQYSGYGTFNTPVKTAAAPAASTSTMGSKGSTKPSVVSPGTQTKRGAVTTAQSAVAAPAASAAPKKPVQSRYQRDDLAMNSRKK